MVNGIKLIKLVLIILSSCPVYLYGNSNPKGIDSITVSEQVYLHIDRKIYVAGENVLFSFYLLNPQNEKVNANSGVGYVLLQNDNNNIVGKSQVKLENGIASGAIYLTDTLKTGYYQVIAYTNYMRNMPENNFFSSQILVANRFDSDFLNLIRKNQSYEHANVKTDNNNLRQFVKVSPSARIFKKREKANFTLNINNPDCKFADISISITEKNAAEDAINTYSYRPNQYVKYLSQSDTNSNSIFLKEDKFMELQGYLSDPVTGNPLPNQQLILSTPDSLTNFNYAQTNNKGEFRFEISDYYGDKEIFIKTRNEEEKKSTPKIILVPKFQESKHIKPSMWPIDSTIINYIQRSQELIRIQKAFNQTPTQYIKRENKSPFPRLYKYPEYSIYPAEYIELKDFTEISREIIPTLKTRKNSDGYTSVFYDVTFKEYLKSNPAIFIDGIYTDNINWIIPWGTSDIDRIDIISTPWYYNNLKFWGIISVFTKNKLWKTIVNADGNLKVKLEGFYESPKLIMPDYSKKQNTRQPDFRQLLYWNSHYKLKSETPATFDFYTSDYATKYLIKVSGITDDGEIIQEFAEIEVTD